VFLGASAFVSVADPPHTVLAQATGSKRYFAIYYTASLSSGTSYVNAGGQEVSIQGSTTGILAYLPSLNRTVLVQQETSMSYAKNWLSVYANGDRVFGITRWQISAQGDETADVAETDLETGRTLSQTAVWLFEPQTLAIVNESLYFVPGLWYSEEPPVFGWTGGGLHVADLTKFGGAEKTLQGQSALQSTVNNGALMSAGGMLFDWQFTNGNSTTKCTSTCLLVIHRLDLGTGTTIQGVQLWLPRISYGSLTNWSFSANDSTFYVAAMFHANETSGGQAYTESNVWVWTIPFSQFINNSIPNGPPSVPKAHYWFDNITAFVPIPAIADSALVGMGPVRNDLLLNMGGSLVFYTMPALTCSSVQSCTGNYTVILGSKPDAQLAYGAQAPPTPVTTTSASPTATSTSTSTTSTTTAGPVPEFPLGVAVVASAAFAIAGAYALIGRRSGRGRPHLG
jgi:hypothetical protein